ASLLYRGRVVGVWIYVATLLLSLIWGLAEAGFDGWALLPFVVAPSVLLAPVLLCLPLLDRGRWRWWTPAITIAALAGVLIICGFAMSRINRPQAGPLPGVIASSIADPSPMRTGTDWPVY